MSQRLISIVLPLYNEEENILPFIEALTDMLAEQLAGFDYEIICVDDGSSDRTLSRMQEAAEKDARIKLISFSRNFGQQAAFTAGLERAVGDVIVTMDSDFQDPPEVIPKMIAEWEQGAEIVYARRATRVDSPFKKLSASLYYRLLSRVSDVEIPRQVGDFRLMDRMVLDNLNRLDEHARYLRGMVAWLGFKHAFVDFERPDRLHGETGYPLSKMLKLAMDGLLNFSFSPLKVGFWVGMLSMFISFVFLVYMIIDSMQRGDWTLYPLFKWLVVILFGFVGAQFMLMWIIGEYIGRIYNDVRHRPIYVVRNEQNFD